MIPFPRGHMLLKWAALLLAGAPAVALLILTLRLALADPYGGLATGGLYPQNLIAPLQTYLFRTALATTLWLAPAVSGTALILGGILARLVAWRAAPGPLALLLAAWLCGPLAGLLWRPLFVTLGWTAYAPSARLAIGLVLLWRLVPFAVLLLSSLTGRRRWAIAFAALAYSVLVDGGTALLLTGGAPFNASHTWASWLLMQLWVSRAWAYAAALAGGLALVAAPVAAGAMWLLGVQPAQVHAAMARQASTGAAWALAVLWTVLPWAAWGSAPLDGGGGLSAYLAAGGLRWVGQWLLALALATALAVGMAAGLRPWPRPITQTAGAVAVGLLPLWPVALSALRQEAAWVGHWWVVAMLVGLAAGPLTALLPGGYTGSGRWLLAGAGVAAGLTYTFGLELVLEAPRSAQLPFLGVAYNLGAAAAQPAALAVGLWVSLALAIAAGAIVAGASSAGVRSIHGFTRRAVVQRNAALRLLDFQRLLGLFGEEQ